MQVAMYCVFYALFWIVPNSFGASKQMGRWWMHQNIVEFLCPSWWFFVCCRVIG